MGLGLAPLFLPNSTPKSKPNDFARKFQADSAKSGANRALAEKRDLAQRLYAANDWEGALDASHEWAEMCVELQDQSGEAQAVLVMADCLSKKDEVDEGLIIGMYSHVMKCASAARDHDSFFSALVGVASLKRALRKWQEATQALQRALESAEGANNPRQVAYAYTQQAFLLLDTPKGDIECVNQEKEIVHLSRDDDGQAPMQVGASPSSQQALKLLQKAKAAIDGPDQPPDVLATAHMNLAQGYLRLGGAANKRKAANEMIAAFTLLHSVTEADTRVVAVARKIVELHEENPWLFGSDAEMASVLETCREKVAQANASRPPVDALGVSSSREDRIERERLQWANEKLAAMQTAPIQGDSDSEEEDQGPVRPKFEGWQRE